MSNCEICQKPATANLTCVSTPGRSWGYCADHKDLTTRLSCCRLEPIAETGVKHDAGKLRWTLLPLLALSFVVRVLMHGASKYPSADNWRRVDNAGERYLDAAFRHLVAFTRGEWLDTESGLPHLAHAIACLLFILELRSEIAQ